MNVQNATSIGVNLSSAANVLLTNVSAANTVTNTFTSTASLYIFGNTTGCIIQGGEWYGASGQALFYSSTGPGNFIKSAYFDSGSTGAEIATASLLSITGSWFSNGRTGGGFPGLQITAGDSITIQGSIFDNSGNDGLLITGGTHIVVTGNEANNNGVTTAGKHGIEVAANVTDFNITNNIAVGNAGFGIIVDTGTSNRYIITGNLITSNTGGGVSDGGSGASKTVSGNW